MKYGKDVYPVYLNVGRAKNSPPRREVYHLYDVTKEKNESAHWIPNVERAGHISTDAAYAIKTDSFDKSISQPEQIVKPHDESSGGDDLLFHYSVRTEPAPKKTVPVYKLTQYVNVDTDQDKFEGITPRQYPSAINKYMRKHFRGVYPTADTTAYVGRTDIDEYSHPANRGMTANNYNAKLKAGTELDRLLKISKYLGHREDDGRHPEATNGWNYYRTLFKVGD